MASEDTYISIISVMNQRPKINYSKYRSEPSVLGETSETFFDKVSSLPFIC